MSKNMLSKIDKTFNINLENGLYSFNDIINTDFLPQRLIRSLDEIRPNFLFIFNLKPTAFLIKTKSN